MEDLFSIPIQFEMTEEETQAYQLAMLWMKKSVEHFPGVRLGPGNALRTTGDPRKSALFKSMIRMIRRTRGMVELTDLKHYMVAQLFICKKNNDEGDCYVTPNMCVGDAAWKRWKLYEKWLKQARERRAGASAPETEQISMEAVNSDFDVSLTFLKKYTEEVTPQFLTDRFEKGDVAKWLKFGFIRPYFVAVSPTLQKLGMQVKALSGVTNEKVIAAFKIRFPLDQ